MFSASAASAASAAVGDMDRLPSTVDLPSSSTPVPRPASRQLTYTTAGTIYNPKTTQPLQPPARRGRSFRWPNGGPHTDLNLFPKAALAALPLRYSSARRSVTPLQYSPLQQNYDRAISPKFLRDLDHQPFSMLAAQLTPPEMDGCVQSCRPESPVTTPPSFDWSGNSPACSGGAKDDRDDDSESDGDFSTDPLAAMTVKSLQNLASYPNPNQKKARRVLRGARSNIQVMGDVPRGRSPPSVVGLAMPTGAPSKPEDLDAWGFYRSGMQGMSSALVQNGAAHRSLPECVRGLGVYGTHPASATGHEDVNQPTSALTVASDAPRPLTAGPPGQRQCRPSTFEATFKALQKCMAPRDRSHQSVGLPGYSTTASKVASMMKEEEIVTGIRKMEYNQPAPTFPTNEYLQAGYDDEHPRFKPGTDRLTDEELRKCDAKIDRCWYSGCVIMNRAVAAERAAGNTMLPRQEHKLGVIGDGRRMRSTNSYRPLSIAEATQMDACEHAAPLLTAAQVSLMRYLEEEEEKKKKRMEREQEKQGDGQEE
ncbi:hypothetical protein GMORB2_5294 [Geosmithia morbida]|uniref:Uncharacterized protein n=1 Tax=Geosmithia morbida TaxID=1094350 RepID=A0A9P4YWZ7_9HYPO|nr:uncharacterized protein GMORB2_5294 [Geosmithia morbida]KAF4124628.1 hypothetical protein GMORB2_5294 [Geosmithia morbida]